MIRDMVLVRQVRGQEPQVFSVSGEKVLRTARLVQAEPRAWRFEPHLGDAGDRRESGLCAGGVAALAHSKFEALELIAEMQ